MKDAANRDFEQGYQKSHGSDLRYSRKRRWRRPLKGCGLDYRQARANLSSHQDLVAIAFTESDLHWLVA